MGRRHFKPEQIIHMLREAEIKLAGGKTTGQVCRELGISEQSYYRWRKEHGGMQVSQARKLKDLERENARLNRQSRIRKTCRLCYPRQRSAHGRGRQDLRDPCARDVDGRREDIRGLTSVYSGFAIAPADRLLLS